MAIMTVAAGVGIANQYYNQPLLEQMGADLHADATALGLAPTLSLTDRGLTPVSLVP